MANSIAEEAELVPRDGGMTMQARKSGFTLATINKEHPEEVRDAP
jgi:hypothetical protein